MIRHRISACRLNWLAHAVRHAHRRCRNDVVLLGASVRDGEIVLEDDLLGLPYTPYVTNAVPAGQFAALVSVDQLSTWLRDRGVEVA